MTPIPAVGDKERNICAEHRKAFKVTADNLPSSVRNCVVYVWGCGEVGFRTGIPDTLELCDRDVTSLHISVDSCPHPICFPHLFPSASPVKCLFPHCDFHVVVKECVVYLIAVLFHTVEFLKHLDCSSTIAEILD